MVKKIDVDTLLAENSLELTLGGKTYTLKDISLPSFLSATAEEKDGEDKISRDTLHRQLEEILGIEKGELEDLGLKAVTLAINGIRSWILDEEEDEKTPSPAKGGKKKESRP